MNGINHVTFVGNLTRDAELSYTQSGLAFSKMSIAINRSRKNGDQWEDRASFFDLVGTGKRFESLNQYLMKGQKIAVECHANQERWEKDGQKRSRVSFVIDNIELVGSKSSSQQNNQSNSFEDDIAF